MAISNEVPTMARSFPAAPPNPGPVDTSLPGGFLIPKIGDPIDGLPESARSKVIGLRQQLEDAATFEVDSHGIVSLTPHLGPTDRSYSGRRRVRVHALQDAEADVAALLQATL